MKKAKVQSNGWTDKLYYITRLGTILGCIMMFFPAANPGYVCNLINKNLSLFTTAISYESLTALAMRPLDKGWVENSSFILLMVAAAIVCVGIILLAASGCMSVGNLKMKRVGNWFGLAGSALMCAGIVMLYMAYESFGNSSRPEKVWNIFPNGMYIYGVLAAILLITNIVIILFQPRPAKEEKCEIRTPMKLFLMFVPIIAMVFVFSYLPLWGWRYAFFDYKAGETLTMEKFVGFKWFTFLFESEATRNDIFRVLKNTLVMRVLVLLRAGCQWHLQFSLQKSKQAGSAVLCRPLLRFQILSAGF